MRNHPRRRALGLVIAGALALVACGPTTEVARPLGTATIAKAAGPSGDITLAFAGDVHFTARTAVLLNDPSTAFGPIATTLSAADFTMVNFESAITSRGTPQPKTFHFRTTPVALEAVRDAGIDAITLGNNHVLDFGQVGLADTLSALKAADFPYVGIGDNAAAAWAPYLTTIKGKRIAVIGVSQVAELASSWVATSTRPGEANAINRTETLAAIRAARKIADIVIVFMHWGTEGDQCPDRNQRSLAAAMSAAGADIIIGAHAHMLQGSGFMGKTFIAYGMGNFLWWENSYSTTTGVLRLTVTPEGGITPSFVPAVVSATGQPIPLTGSAAAQASAHYASLRSCAGLSATPSG